MRTSAASPILAAVGVVLILAAHGVGAATVLQTWTDLNATYYYDNSPNSHRTCSALHGGSKWSDYVLDGTSACGRSIRKMNTNAVVAMNVTWLNERGIAARTEDLCGRELQILRDGTPVEIKGGPFFLWEGCQACASLPRVDLSVAGYIAVSGDKECARGTVPGVEVRLLDNFVHRGSLDGAAGRGAAVGAGVVAAAAAATVALLLACI